MTEKPYPNKQEIRTILLPYLRTFWVLVFLTFITGLAVEVYSTLPNALGRFGGLCALESVFFYFYLEKNDFFTGHQAFLFDSNNHAEPRALVGPSITFAAITGTILNLFGDVVISLFNCGQMTCAP